VGRHAGRIPRVTGPEGAAVIRLVDPRVTGFGIGRRSTAETDRLHPVSEAGIDVQKAALQLRSVVASGRTHADWHQAVVRPGDRR
jgi:hypothetical protein